MTVTTAEMIQTGFNAQYFRGEGICLQTFPVDASAKSVTSDGAGDLFILPSGDTIHFKSFG